MDIKFNIKFGAVLASTATIAAVVVPVAAQTSDMEQEVAYSDVPTEYTHYSSILEARMLGVLSGYEDGIFKPYQSLTRANVVKALGKYVVEKSGKEIEDFNLSEVTPFNDVQSDYPDKELYTYSLIVKQAGIFQGSNNNLMPTNLIQRQQMAQVLVNAFGLENLSDKESSVKDYDKAWKDFRDAIDVLSENGVTTEEDFRPTESTTRGQFASFLVRAYKVSEGLDPEKLYPASIVSVDSLEDITITVEESLELPKTVDVVLESGLDATADVEWNTESLDTEKSGTYLLTGKVADTDLPVSLNVVVKEPTYTEIASLYMHGHEIIIDYGHEMTESALDLSNYKFNGGPWPAGTTIEGDKRAVMITIPSPQQVIHEDIEYTFEITQNVKTKKGDIITGNAFAQDFEKVGPLNLTDTGYFSDNVAPELVSAQYIVPSADSTLTELIQLTFSESMDIIEENITVEEYDGFKWGVDFEATLSNIQDDVKIKMGETEVDVQDYSVEGDKIYFSIPSMDVNQDTTLSIVPAGEENEELAIIDASRGNNPVDAPVTKTITKYNVVVIGPDEDIEPDLK